MASRTHIAPAWYRWANPLAPVNDLWTHRELLGQLVRREIEGRYRGSNLGIAWSLVTPLCMLAIYTFVFSVIFKARWRPEGEVAPADFAITLFAGLIAFNVFAETVSRAPGLIVGNPAYVKRVVFPLQILPASALGASLFHALLSVAILVAGELLVLGTVPRGIVLLPVVALPLVGLTLGLGWILASLGVYLRDTAYAVGIATQMLFFCTPVLYRIEAVPPRYRPLLYLNPLSPVVDGFRRILVWNEPLDWTAWLAVTLVSGAVFSLGYAWFMKTKAGFADVI